MTLCEKIKKELIEEIKNKSVLELAFLIKQAIPEFKNKTMDNIVKSLESESDTE